MSSESGNASSLIPFDSLLLKIMIKVTRFNHTELIVNADMIEFVEHTPDTVITMLTGRKVLVLESAKAPGEKIRGKSADFVRKAINEYIAKIYHTPFDEYRPDWDFSGYPVIVQFALDVARAAADASTLPTWLPGDEFRKARELSGVK